MLAGMFIPQWKAWRGLERGEWRKREREQQREKEERERREEKEKRERYFLPIIFRKIAGVFGVEKERREKKHSVSLLPPWWMQGYSYCMNRAPNSPASPTPLRSPMMTAMPHVLWSAS